MPTPNSFNTIRHWEGSQHRAFEEIAYQLLRNDIPFELKPVRTGNPDGGVEWYVTLPSDEEWGWQAKYVSGVESLLNGMTESVKRVVAERPKCVKLTFAISMNLPSGTAGGKNKSARRKYEDKVAAWKSSIPGADRIDFELIQESELLDRLSLTEHRGRRWFWWHQTVFDHDWLLNLQERQEAIAGPRYRPELQVDLSIQRDVEGLSVAKYFDNEFAEFVYRMAKSKPYFWSRDAEQFPDLMTSLSQLTLEIDQFHSVLAGRQPFSLGLDGLDDVRQSATSCLKHLRTVYEDVLRARDKVSSPAGSSVTVSNNDTQSLSAILSGLHSVIQNVRDISDWLDETSIRSAERGRYFLCGPAGSGKTHLFLDSARSALNHGRLAIVLFGDRFQDDIWASICSQLGIESIGSNELLGALEAAAQASSEGKLLILIDALNETPTRNYWRTNLPVLRASLQQFPNVALAVSCRDTYLEAVDPDNERQHFVAATHPGFAGMEVEATQRYFAHYGLQIPRVPLLLPEFSIPLFLKLYCETLRDSDSPDLSLGHEGRIAIFERYLERKVEAVRQHVYQSIHSTTQLKHRRLMIRKALGSVIDLLAEGTSTWISWERAIEAVVESAKCSEERANEILGAFENEGLLSREPAHFRFNTDGLEVRITFQAFSDFLILNQRLSKYDDPLTSDDFKSWLGEHEFSGIMEVATILIPERYSVEVPDLLELQNLNFDDARQDAYASWVYRTFIGALPYRKSSSVTERTVYHFNVAWKIGLGSYDIPFLMAPYPDNLLNASSLHRHLMRFSMAERDAQFGVATYWEIGESSSPISRLAQWASQGPYPDYPTDVIELSATALSWLLSSANRGMRDWVTKALVQLLHGHLDVMHSLLDRFWNVNDPYVVQREMLIAYGCLMRGGLDDRQGARKLVQSVVEKFTEEPLRMDELVLDAGKAIVEWGIAHEFVTPDVRTTLARPHGFPTLGHPLSVKRIKAKYITGYDAPRDATYSTIFGSVLSYGDFGRYVVDSAVYRFSRLPPGTRFPPKSSSQPRINEQAIHRFEKSLTSEQMRLLNDYCLNTENPDFSALLYPDDQISPIGLTVAQHRLLEAVWVQPPTPKDVGFPSQLARRWLFLRTISLGWRPELFGETDHYRTQRNDGRSEHKAERWGKKYQWMAFHELMARIADNYQPRPEWGEDEAQWNPFLRLDHMRDLDASLPPVGYRDFVVRNENAFSWKASGLGLPGKAGHAINFVSYHGDADRFIKERCAEPLAHTISVRRDIDGQEWIALHTSESTRESVGEKREWGLTQTIFLHSWFVSGDQVGNQAKKLLNALVANLSNINAPSHERGTYIGEVGWRNRQDTYMTASWRRLGRENGPEVDVIDTCEDYVWEDSGLDCSIDNAAFAYVPSQFILNHEPLSLTEEGPGWKDSLGRTVLVNTRGPHQEYPEPHLLWARRDWLHAFLARENLGLVVATSFERLSHLLVQKTDDGRETTLSAALLTADGQFRRVGAPWRSPWPLDDWVEDD